MEEISPSVLFGPGGDAGAYALDEYGEEALTEPWHTALGALLDAAMVHGAPRLVDDEGATALTTAWNQV